MQNRDLIETIIQLMEVECILLFSHELFAVHVVSGNVPVVYVVAETRCRNRVGHRSGVSLAPRSPHPLTNDLDIRRARVAELVALLPDVDLCTQNVLERSIDGDIACLQIWS
jgi:hypothetical protein